MPDSKNPVAILLWLRCYVISFLLNIVKLSILIQEICLAVGRYFDKLDVI